MKTILKVIAATALSVVVIVPAHASLKDAVQAYKSGNWTVLRSVDAMRDTID